MEILDTLQGLDAVWAEEAQNILDYIVKGGAYSSNVFESPVEMMGNDIRPSTLIGKRGVYLFIITAPKHLSRAEVQAWDSAGSAGFDGKLEVNLNVGDCLYLGSCASESSGSLYVRIGQHQSSSYSGLKLNHKSRSFAGGIVKIYAFPARRIYKSFYRIILTAIEKKLHNKLEPKAGSSRV